MLNPPPERLSFLRRYSYTLAVAMAIGSCGLNASLAVKDYLAHATIPAVIATVGATAVAIGCWVTVWLEQHVRATQAGLTANIRQLEELGNALLNSTRKDGIDSAQTTSIDRKTH